jgi:hypothetical protein
LLVRCRTGVCCTFFLPEKLSDKAFNDIYSLNTSVFCRSKGQFLRKARRFRSGVERQHDNAPLRVKGSEPVFCQLKNMRQIRKRISSQTGMTRKKASAEMPGKQRQNRMYTPNTLLPSSGFHFLKKKSQIGDLLKVSKKCKNEAECMDKIRLHLLQTNPQNILLV